MIAQMAASPSDVHSGVIILNSRVAAFKSAFYFLLCRHVGLFFVFFICRTPLREPGDVEIEAGPTSSAHYHWLTSLLAVQKSSPPAVCRSIWKHSIRKSCENIVLPAAEISAQIKCIQSAEACGQKTGSDL